MFGLFTRPSLLSKRQEILASFRLAAEQLRETESALEDAAKAMREEAARMAAFADDHEEEAGRCRHAAGKLEQLF